MTVANSETTAALDRNGRSLRGLCLLSREEQWFRRNRRR